MRTATHETRKALRAALDEIARTAGYETWRKLETAVMNGRVRVVPADTGKDG